MHVAVAWVVLQGGVLPEDMLPGAEPTKASAVAGGGSAASPSGNRGGVFHGIQAEVTTEAFAREVACTP